MTPTATVTTAKPAPKDFKSEIPPDWCPGCGDFGVLNVLQRACSELGLKNHEILVVSGIGCSSNLPGFFKSYGVHSLHGRSLPVAMGAKLANHALTVIATGGDGDGYGIGGNHFIHAMRRNVDVTYIVMNNEIYGLTTGQVSPTSEIGMKTKSTPAGNVDMPLNPLALAVAAGCGYVARGFSGDVKQLTQLYIDAIKFPGFALVDVFSPCVTFNKHNTYDFFKKRIYKLEDTGHDPSDYLKAMAKTQEWGEKIPIGLFYKNPDPRPSLDRADPALKPGPLALRPGTLTKAQRKAIVEEMR